MTGLLTLKKGRPERAIQLLIKAAKTAPDRPEILCDLGNAFKAMGRHKDAISAHRMVVSLLPKSPEALSNLGCAYNAAGESAKAIEAFQTALKLRPRDAELMFNLGNGLIAAERHVEAESILRQVVYQKPEHERAQINLGVALKESGKYEAALERFQKAIAAYPESADAHWNLALTHLALGQYEDGWREYEWRLRLPGFSQWQGDKLNGRTLLVHAEQGLGDAIQFVRYLRLLEDAGGPVVFACPARLVPLLGAMPGAAQIVPFEARPAHDVQTPLLSLPRLIDKGAPLATGEPAYLRADPDRAARAAATLGPKTRRRIGIAWQGSADYRHDGRRSIPLSAFAPLAADPGIELISLQQGDDARQIDDIAWRDRITRLPDDTDRDGAFLDTLAVMAHLDMVVTSDTSIAHLAGAAGVPVAVALCRLPDWRWGLAGERSPWYPRMHLFRQTHAGDWDEVFERIAAHVRAARRNDAAP